VGAEAERPFKAYTPFFDHELKQIDDWGFSNRIRARAEAIRTLVLKALANEEARPRSRT